MLKRLNEIKRKEKVVFKYADENLDQEFHQGLLNLGLLPNDLIEIISGSFLGSPITISYRGISFVSIRKELAQHLWVETQF